MIRCSILFKFIFLNCSLTLNEKYKELMLINDRVNELILDIKTIDFFHYLMGNGWVNFYIYKNNLNAEFLANIFF